MEGVYTSGARWARIALGGTAVYVAIDVTRPVAGPLTALSFGAIVPILLLGRVHLRPHSLGGPYEKLFLAVELAWLAIAAAWPLVRGRVPRVPAVG